MKIIRIRFTNGMMRDYAYTLPESTWIKKLDADCDRDGLTVESVQFLTL